MLTNFLSNLLNASLLFSILVAFFVVTGVKEAQSKHSEGPVKIQTVFCINEEAARGFKNIYKKEGQRVVPYLKSGAVPGCQLTVLPFNYDNFYEVIPNGSEAVRVFKGHVKARGKELPVFMLCPVYEGKEPQHICTMPGENP